MKLSKDFDAVVLDHGTGGLLSSDLIECFIVPLLEEVYVGGLEDSASLDVDGSRVSMTSDSFVVDPIFFANGNIGKIAVCGTVNDLACSGSTPKYLTLSLVIEEGFLLEDLRKILVSVRDAAREASVCIVAGDTKVVRKGELDKIFINTAGVGFFRENDVLLSQRNVRAGDDIIVSGFLGNHSIHILSLREGLGYESRVLSDCAPLNGMVKEVVRALGPDLHCVRDLTRGGLSSALHEISRVVRRKFLIHLASLPVQHEVQMASDMLGVNPIHLANEGKICLFLNPTRSADALEVLHGHVYGRDAAVVGRVLGGVGSGVVGVTSYGMEMPIDYLYGVELPRLC